MIDIILEKNICGLDWLDLEDPTLEELQGLARKWGIHPKIVEDCLDPAHLPKYEGLDAGFFAVLRFYDEKALAAADTVQALTRKVSIFCGPDFMITIHRKPMSCVTVIKDFWRRSHEGSVNSRAILGDFLVAVSDSYNGPLSSAEEALEHYEQNVFLNHSVIAQMHKIHFLKRQVALLRRMLWFLLSVAVKVQPHSREDSPFVEDAKDSLAATHQRSDELIEDINALLSIQLSIDSHRTNEVMRVLTVFSVFFMPLTFVVGLYGMNFRHMPELEWRFGYPAVLLALVVISVGFLIWFRRRGYLR